MLKNRKWLSAAGGIALVALLAAPALSGNGALTAPTLEQAKQAFARTAGIGRSPVENAAITFVRAVSERDASTVWMYASEEEQDAFATEEAIYEAYAETFPALTQAGKLTPQRSWSEGDTPFVELILAAGSEDYRVTMGLWLDDAGDWKVVSCDVTALSDRVAGL
jgi:hypothetical protein